MKLSEEQRQSLITSLLEFVRRVSFHGAGSPEEALGFPEIVGLLSGVSLTADYVVEEICPGLVDDVESYCEQESENSGTWQECECGCSQCLLREKRCPSFS